MEYKNSCSVSSILFLTVTILSSFSIALAEIADTGVIYHDPVNHSVAGDRIQIVVMRHNAADVKYARVYFKSKSDSAYMFMPMKLDGAVHKVSLPPCRSGIGAVEYRIVLVSDNDYVFSSMPYEVKIEDGGQARPASNETITVFTELSDVPRSILGFAGNIAIYSIEPAKRYLATNKLAYETGPAESALALQSTEVADARDLWGSKRLPLVVLGAGAAVAVIALRERDEDRPPRFADGSTLMLDVPENTKGNIGSPITATDLDGDPITYSLSGVDANSFQIGETSGQLSVDASTTLDFETQTYYSFQVDSTANGLVASRLVNVSVSDVDEPPRFADGSTLMLGVSENTKGNIGSPVTATDPDGDPITHSLSGVDANSFQIGETSGQLSVDASTTLDFETQTYYSFQVDSTANGLVASRLVNVSVSNVDEPPARIPAPQISDVTGTTATVSWTEPVNLGPPINNYDVRFRQLTQGWMTHNFTGTNTRTKITNLLEDSSYEVQVRATNEEGSGDWSDSLSFTTLAGLDTHTQWQALVAFYIATNGNKWQDNTNWRLEGPTPSEEELNSFFGVTVTGKHVVSVELIGNNLSGHLPPEVGDLTKLGWFILDKNKLTGRIPAELGALSNLEALRLGENSLMGEIPPELGQLSRVVHLDLHGNSLTGEIPPELGQLSRVDHLDLHGNSLTGEIPPELGDLQAAYIIDLSENKLMGSIPPEIWGGYFIEEIYLNDNNLTGEITSDVMNAEHLWRLNVSDNALTGELSSQFMVLYELYQLHWQQRGGVDDELCAPTNADFQEWLKTLGDAKGPNCPESSNSAIAHSLHPVIEGVSIVSEPGSDGAYSAGEIIEIKVEFSGVAAFADTSFLYIDIGQTTVRADLKRHSAPKMLSHLVFRYVVRDGDTDMDGISVGPDALQLNGGRIGHGANAIARADLGRHAIVNASGHIVMAASHGTERRILEEAMAAQSRAYLTSVRGAIAERFRTDRASFQSSSLGVLPRPHDQQGLAEADFQVSEGESKTSAKITSLQHSHLGRHSIDHALLETTPHFSGRAQRIAQRWDFTVMPNRASSGELGRPQWTLWGTQDRQRYVSESSFSRQDGSLRTVYIGADGPIGEGWLAGAAIARSDSEIRYGFSPEKSSLDGSLGINMKAFHPYLNRRFSGGLDAWAMGGIGAGEAVMESKSANRRGRSDLVLRLGAVGVRRTLDNSTSLKLSLVADTGFSRIQTGSAQNPALDQLGVSIAQTRVGMEGKHHWTLASRTLSPYWQVNWRHDRGSGVEGIGMEIVYGSRYRTDWLRLQVEGRRLASHASSSYEESSSSASLDIEPGEHGLGMAVSLSSRRGLFDGRIRPLWQYQDKQLAYGLGVHPTVEHPGRVIQATNGRVSYGLPFAGPDGLMTAFGEIRQIGKLSKLRRIGVIISRTVHKRPMEVELCLWQRELNQESDITEARLDIAIPF